MGFRPFRFSRNSRGNGPALPARCRQIPTGVPPTRGPPTGSEPSLEFAQIALIAYEKAPLGGLSNPLVAGAGFEPTTFGL